MNKHQSTNFKNASALFLIIISLLASSAFAAAPANAVFTGAQLVTPTATINFNSTDSPSTASITLCDETTIASAFMWYEIPAVSYVRTISVDTCNTDFDTVLGVFSGSSYASLSVIACNDDRALGTGDACYPTSSFIDNINIASGEVIYVVMGGYKNTTSGIADSGVGQITFSLISGDDVPCSSALLNETQTAVINQLSSTDSSLQSDISTSQSHVDSSISSFESSIQTQFDSSSSSLETAIAGVQSTADTIQTDMNTANANLGTLQTTVDSVDSKVNTAQSTLDNANTNVGDVSTQLTNVNSNIDTQFLNANNSIQTLQTTENNINTAVGNVESALTAAQSSLDSLQTQLATFASNMDANFTSTDTQLSSVNTAVVNLGSQLGSSNTTLSNDITTVQNSVSVLQGNVTAALNVLNGLQSSIKSDMTTQIYNDNLKIFLSNATLTPPVTFRIPNLFGGQMDTVASSVTSLYNSLRTQALGVGSASSTNCKNDAFCNYFLNTGAPAYVDSISKYNSYVSVNKYKVAYSYLQKAYSSLLPTTW